MARLSTTLMDTNTVQMVRMFFHLRNTKSCCDFLLFSFNLTFHILYLFLQLLCVLEHHLNRSLSTSSITLCYLILHGGSALRITTCCLSSGLLLTKELSDKQEHLGDVVIGAPEFFVFVNRFLKLLNLSSKNLCLSLDLG